MTRADNAAKRPRLMGVVNVTPDSFSDGGRFFDPDKAVAHGLALAAEGADILDVGGESTRPGAEPVGLEEERARVMPVIEGLLAKGASATSPVFSPLISIDTRKADIAREAVNAGAAIWNDVSALINDAHSLETAASLSCDIVLMHAQGTPQTMQQNPYYDDVVGEVFDFLAARIAACEAAGIDRARLIVDPGVGFGKTLAHNLALLNGLERFHDLGAPVLVGASRKRFIAALDRPAGQGADQTQNVRPDDRLGGSLAAALAAAARGASIVRVHDVAATRQALAVFQAIEEGAPPAEVKPR